MAATIVSRLAGVGIGAVDRQEMFINMIAMDVMQMAFVQIIGVAVMLNGRVTAAGVVLVRMIVVFLASHRNAP
jgi:hypothetical protein